MQELIMLKTSHKHFLFCLLCCRKFVSHFQELDLDPWPLNLYWGVLLSSLFLSLLLYCPRLTAFTSWAVFIWPLCQPRQIDPAAIQYLIVEVTAKITINPSWFDFLSTDRVVSAWLKRSFKDLVGCFLSKALIHQIYSPVHVNWRLQLLYNISKQNHTQPGSWS